MFRVRLKDPTHLVSAPQPSQAFMSILMKALTPAAPFYDTCRHQAIT